MHKLVLLRHGESAVEPRKPLHRLDRRRPVAEGRRGGARRRAACSRPRAIAFDFAYTSVLKRAIRTLWIALEELDQMWLPEEKDWRLNERHYGALQGLNKAETAAKYGEEQVLVWRRSYDTPPPPLTPDDPRYEGSDPRYARRSRCRSPNASRTPWRAWFRTGTAPSRRRCAPASAC